MHTEHTEHKTFSLRQLVALKNLYAKYPNTDISHLRFNKSGEYEMTFTMHNTEYLVTERGQVFCRDWANIGNQGTAW